MYWAYLAVFVLVGVPLDWAVFDRMRNQVDMFWPIKDGFGYRDLLFPRVWITILSTMIVGIGALEAPPHTWLIVLGGSLFLLSHFYAHYRIWRFGRRR
ncbi:hypothetical protein SH591_11610 [Sphingomonas sp. LY54]|uniref:hypothetical protein n=1 Tax=Sphingomonas sp. LY54 TaxID=3095343 RepID=UPI002D76DEB0|nr:hypothetical protein [Sphingomonas sp. LY54]WRP27749.1 hypothetical protein SH591_11610 [Sphingomonas sp. LY54]